MIRKAVSEELQVSGNVRVIRVLAGNLPGKTLTATSRSSCSLCSRYTSPIPTRSELL